VTARREGNAAEDRAQIRAVRAAIKLYSHDIRAAVSDVIGGLRLIDRARLDSDTQDQVERVQIAGEALAELVDAALLELDGRADESAVDQVFDFRSFLAGVEMRWSGRAREQGLIFRLDVDRDVPERVSVARIKLDRILGNLIANALKFTDQGRVTLKVACRDDQLEFSVRDQGAGFSDTALERLFTPDGRPQDATRPGTGLGLHISKDLADSLGAELTVINLPGHGAEVRLRLPPEGWQPDEAEPVLPDLSDLSVLVAEDNETNQIIVRQMLERMGARMRLARDGVEALAALKVDRFDIALLDIEMPRMTGIEVMRDLRARGAVPETPLVALTAYILRDNREAIYAAGADGVIAKPIRSIQDFGQAIRRHVDRSGDGPAPVPDPEVTQRIGQLDRNRFDAILQAAGPDGREEFLRHLLADLRSVARLLHAGVEGRDAGLVRAQTHILISLAGAVGADRLQGLAESLNATAHRGRLEEAPTLVATCRQALAILIEQVERRAAREA